MQTKRYGKTIKLFLMDADPQGRIVCELSNWTGKAYRIPRSKVKDCAERDDLKGTAVYLLFGPAESATAKPSVYIGETENAYKRLVDHIEGKEFWNEAVVFTSKDENLNKAHIKYLESRLHEIATDANRYQIENNNTPTQSAISEADQAEMEEFTEYIQILINTLGFKVFEPLIKPQSQNGKDDYLRINAARGAGACGKRSNDGFIVVKGSVIAKEPVVSFTKGFNTLREELISSGIIAVGEVGLTFTTDYLFSSPSTAAAIVMGRNANGLVEWKDAQKQTLKDIEAREISGEGVE